MHQAAKFYSRCRIPKNPWRWPSRCLSAPATGAMSWNMSWIPTPIWRNSSCRFSISNWLVVFLEHDFYFPTVGNGMSSSQLTSPHIFQRNRSTTHQAKEVLCWAGPLPCGETHLQRISPPSRRPSGREGRETGSRNLKRDLCHQPTNHSHGSWA